MPKWLKNMWNVSIENCNFKSIDLYVERAKQITMKNSTVYGDGKVIFDAYAAKIENNFFMILND